MNFSKQQQAAIAVLYQALVDSVSSTPTLLEHMQTLRECNLRVAQIELHLYVEPLASAPSAPAQSDLDFLRSLRIAPDLSIEGR
jgi:hypothetical protein